MQKHDWIKLLSFNRLKIYLECGGGGGKSSFNELLCHSPKIDIHYDLRPDSDFTLCTSNICFSSIVPIEVINRFSSLLTGVPFLINSDP